MEVHHHPDIHHKPKKWKEYFLEFLMIFLAVSLGFLAENLREHMTERAKEKQYIEGFIRNLKDDTANLHHVIEFNKRQLKGLDTLLKLSHANMDVDSNRKSFYLAIHYCYNSSTFKSNDATLQQLKSTGDYRLIEKDHVVDSLTKYDVDMNNVYSQGGFYEAYFKEIMARLDELIDVSVLIDTKEEMKYKPLSQLQDKEKLRVFFNKAFLFDNITDSYIKYNLQPQLQNANRLIIFLKNEYNIKD